jgi:selT/selW/selH-like putative selenoprotein
MILERTPGAQVKLRKSRGGVFEITVDGRLRYSKRASGRFPSSEEVLATLG